MAGRVGAWRRRGDWERDVTDELAIDFIVRSEWQIWASAFALAVLGAAMSALLFISSARLARPSYFLGCCIVLLVMALSKGLLVPTRNAVEKGHMAEWLALWGLVQVGCGFALWRLSLARLNHVGRHWGLAALAFVPLANLWLFLTSGQGELAVVRDAAGSIHRERSSGPAATRLIAGIAVIAVALMALVQIDKLKRSALVTAKGIPFGALVQYVLNRDGVEKTIALIAGVPVGPEEQSGMIRKIGHSADGATLKRTFLIDSDNPKLVDPSDPELGKLIRGAVVQRACEEEDLVPLMKAGATIEETYRDRQGREIETVTVTWGDCAS